MLYIFSIISVLIVLLVTLPVLITVAYVTVAERKTMASMQRRIGPNLVGYYGLLQAFADALKLILKEYVAPSLSNKILFFTGPSVNLIFSLLGFAMIPYLAGLAISDFDLGILYVLAVSSLSTYGILLAGWSANSKYAFLGSLRSTAQLISYELILTSAILLIILISGNLNLSVIIEAQKSVWSILPLFPIFAIFFICSIAETNRAPFDLAEAESELVSGFMTEHAAVIFVYFFLGEYASIVLICTLIGILFLGGYLLFYNPVLYIIDKFSFFSFDVIYYKNINFLNYSDNTINSIYDGLFSSISLGFKTILLVFGFILIRASYPRIRFDQLMSYCWTILLPLIVAFILLMPCILYGLEIFPNNDILFVSYLILPKSKHIFKRKTHKRCYSNNSVYKKLILKKRLANFFSYKNIIFIIITGLVIYFYRNLVTSNGTFWPITVCISIPALSKLTREILEALKDCFDLKMTSSGPINNINHMSSNTNPSDVIPSSSKDQPIGSSKWGESSKWAESSKSGESSKLGESSKSGKNINPWTDLIDPPYEVYEGEGFLYNVTLKKIAYVNNGWKALAGYGNLGICDRLTSYQPYGKNLANALQYVYDRDKDTSLNYLEEKDLNFIKDALVDKGKSKELLSNSTHIREILKNLD